MAHNGAEDRLEVEGGADRLTHFTQRSQLADRLPQLARPSFEFLKETYVLDGDNGLRSESFEKGDLFVSERLNSYSPNENSPDGDALSQQRNGEHRPSIQVFRDLPEIPVFFALSKHVMNMNR